MKRLIFPILVLILIITSCEFVPEEVPETIIENRGIPPPIKFNLNNYNDTIKLGTFTEFSYSLNAYKTNILSVKISLGEQTLINYIKGQNQQSLFFEINPVNYNNGNYVLQIEIVAGSGTGSIADKLDAEGYIFKIDWPVMIDKTQPGSNSCILRAGYTKQAIDLNWEPFNHLLFRSYTIYRTTRSLLYKPVKVAEINEKFLTTFRDTSFWNGEMNYYFLRINTPTGYSEGEMVGVYDSITGLKAELRNDGTVSVIWDKAENIESFGRYYVYSYFNSSSILEKYYINDPDQNYAILSNPGFAYGLNISLKFIPKDVNENNYSSIKGTSIKFYPIPVLPEHLKSYPVNGRDFILIAKAGKLYRYNPHTKTVSDSITTRLPGEDMLAVSNDGRLFSYTDFTNIYVRRTDDFTIESQFPSPPLIKPKQWNPNFENLAFFSISNNGKLAVGDFDGITYLYDALSGSLINKDTILIDGVVINNGILSTDGTLLIVSSGTSVGPKVTSFALDDVGWKEESKIQSFTNPFFIWSADGLSLYLAGNDRVEKRNKDLTFISKFTKSFSMLEGIDIQNDRILYDNVNYQTIYNINTGYVIRTLQCGSEGFIQPYYNFLINSNGLQITLPE